MQGVCQGCLCKKCAGVSMQGVCRVGAGPTPPSPRGEGGPQGLVPSPKIRAPQNPLVHARKRPVRSGRRSAPPTPSKTLKDPPRARAQSPPIPSFHPNPPLPSNLINATTSAQALSHS
jgi:hypothetical protein